MLSSPLLRLRLRSRRIVRAPVPPSPSRSWVVAVDLRNCLDGGGHSGRIGEEELQADEDGLQVLQPDLQVAKLRRDVLCSNLSMQLVAHLADRQERLVKARRGDPNDDRGTRALDQVAAHFVGQGLDGIRRLARLEDSQVQGGRVDQQWLARLGIGGLDGRREVAGRTEIEFLRAAWTRRLRRLDTHLRRRPHRTTRVGLSHDVARRPSTAQCCECRQQ